jgi:hypothetical protein
VTAGLLVLVNGRVRTADPRRPIADAVVIQAGRVVFAGSSAEARKMPLHDGRLIDVRGASVRPVPGAMLRRDAPASFEVTRPSDGTDRVVFRMIDGRVELDELHDV